MATDTEQLNPLQRPTMSVEEAGDLLGISRCSAYRAASTGELPTIRVGKRLRVPTAVMRRLLHLDDQAVTT